MITEDTYVSKYTGEEIEEAIGNALTMQPENYEPNGTAEQVVTTHNVDAGAHAELFGAVGARFDNLSSASLAKVGDIIASARAVDDTFLPCSGQALVKSELTEPLFNLLGYRAGSVTKVIASDKAIDGNSYAAPCPGAIVVMDDDIVVVEPTASNSSLTTTTSQVRVIDRKTLAQVRSVSSSVQVIYESGLVNTMIGLGCKYNGIAYIPIYTGSKYGYAAINPKTGGTVSANVWSDAPYRDIIAVETPFGVLMINLNNDILTTARLYTSPTSYTSVVMGAHTCISQGKAIGSDKLYNGFSYFTVSDLIFSFDGSTVRNVGNASRSTYNMAVNGDTLTTFSPTGISTGSEITAKKFKLGNGTTITKVYDNAVAIIPHPSGSVYSCENVLVSDVLSECICLGIVLKSSSSPYPVSIRLISLSLTSMSSAILGDYITPDTTGNYKGKAMPSRGIFLNVHSLLTAGAKARTNLLAEYADQVRIPELNRSPIIDTFYIKAMEVQ